MLTQCWNAPLASSARHFHRLRSPSSRLAATIFLPWCKPWNLNHDTKRHCEKVSEQASSSSAQWLLIHIHHRWDDVSGCSYTYIIDGCGGNDIPTRQMKITKRYSSEAAVRSVGLFHILELCIYRFEIRNSRRTRTCLRGRHCETQHVPVKHYCGCKYTLQSTVWYATPKAPSTIVAQVCTTPSTNTI